MLFAVAEAILFPQLLLLTLVVAWADGNLGPRVWPGGLVGIVHLIHS